MSQAAAGLKRGNRLTFAEWEMESRRPLDDEEIDYWRRLVEYKPMDYLELGRAIARIDQLKDELAGTQRVAGQLTKSVVGHRIGRLDIYEDGTTDPPIHLSIREREALAKLVKSYPGICPFAQMQPFGKTESVDRHRDPARNWNRMYAARLRARLVPYRVGITVMDSFGYGLVEL
jgi:hypothetical protein